MPSRRASSRIGSRSCGGGGDSAAHSVCVAVFVDRGIWRYLLGLNHVFKDEDLLIYNKLLDNIEAAER